MGLVCARGSTQRWGQPAFPSKHCLFLVGMAEMEGGVVPWVRTGLPTHCAHRGVSVSVAQLDSDRGCS